MRAAIGLLAVLLCCMPTTPAEAQVRPERADSLEAELRVLRARVDSLSRVLALLAGQARDTAQVADELAALRAAARAAAARVEPADTGAGQASRTRALQALNPEISVTRAISSATSPRPPATSGP